MLLTAEVAGESVKPVKGDGGTRVPLLRAGFRPNGPYAVSFVYVQPGTPFAKRGDARLAVPRMDLPINVMEWELFLPDRYRVKNFDGQALAATLMPAVFTGTFAGERGYYNANGDIELSSNFRTEDTGPRGSGQVQGRVTDETGAAIPGATVLLTGTGVARYAISDPEGEFVIDGVPGGALTLKAELPGFGTVTRPFRLRDGDAVRLDTALRVATVAEEVAVTAEAPKIVSRKREKSANEPQVFAPSSNVANLQRRVSGVLPVRMDIPRAGVSYRFVRPLVVGEETTVSFSYKAK